MTDKVQLFEFLYETCQQDNDFLANTLDNFINSLSDEELNELEDCLINNFGED
jgi:hypothetical protein